MVQADVRDARDQRRDHSCRIKPAAHARLEHGDVHRLVGEVPQRRRGEDLEERRLVIAQRTALARDQPKQIRRVGVADHLPVNLNPFAQINPELQQNILIFYSNARPPIQTKKKKQSWAKTEEEVKALKAWAPAATVPSGGS